MTVPPGTYLCRIAEVMPGTTKTGDDRWGYRLVVAEGEFVGRQAAWDGISFSERGLPRARLVLAALGLPSSGRVSLEPDDLLGREVFAEVRPEDYVHPETGQCTRRNVVAYDGYRTANGTVPTGSTGATDDPDSDASDDDVDEQMTEMPF